MFGFNYLLPFIGRLMSRYEDWKRYYLGLSRKERKQADTISIVIDIAILGVLGLLLLWQLV